LVGDCATASSGAGDEEFGHALPEGAVVEGAGLVSEGESTVGGGAEGEAEFHLDEDGGWRPDRGAVWRIEDGVRRGRGRGSGKPGLGGRDVGCCCGGHGGR